MSKIRLALFTHLQTVARSVFPDAEVYPMRAVRKKPPRRFVTYQRTGNDAARHLRGGSDITQSRWQVDIWADKASDADRLSDAIRTSLDNRRTEIGTAGHAADVSVVFIVDDSEEYVPPVDSSQSGRARVRMDVTIWHPVNVSLG